MELVEVREVELRIGTSSIQLSKDDELTEVKFSEILRTFVQVRAAGNTTSKASLHRV